MKKILMAATAIATLGVATPAFALPASPTESVQTQQFIVNGVNPPKCDIIAADNTADLANNEISDDDGFARTDVGARIATALTALSATAWCTGANNKVVLTRTPLATGPGTPVDGFNRAVIYDVAVTIAGASRLDAYVPETEATEDGPGNGPQVGHFGPDGAGSLLSFSNYLPGDISSATTVGSGEGPRTDYPSDSSRLVAGTYTSTLTLTITPGD